jgi:hypothetical protein
LATTVAIPFWGKGIFQKLPKRRKNGSQIKTVGMTEISIRGRSFLNFASILMANDISFTRPQQEFWKLPASLW